MMDMLSFELVKANHRISKLSLQICNFSKAKESRSIKLKNFFHFIIIFFFADCYYCSIGF